MIIVITGPTGVGKTSLSIELAKKYNAEIINADSMQIYRELNIGTAKVTQEEKAGITHHLFDIVDVNDNYTIYNYQNDCRNTIKEIISRGKNVIIVGGSGLYIKSALYDYDLKEENCQDELFDNLTNEELLTKINDIDKTIIIDKNNRKRLVRTYNKLLKNTYNVQENNKIIYDNVVIVGLTTDRNTLYEKINNRVDKMIKDGLIDEVESLYNKQINSKAINTGIGYKELYKYFNKEINLEEAIDLIKKNSRHYAKRQYTWFNNQMDIKWFEVNYDDFSKTTANVEKYINELSKNW